MPTIADLTVAALQLSRDAMKELRVVAREHLLAAATDEERLARARHIYWECPAIPAKLIAGALWGDEKLANDVAAWVGALEIGPCGCGEMLTVKTRSQLASVTGSQARGWLRDCDKCCEARAEKSRLARQDEEAHVRHLQTMPYREYLQTEEWQAKRRQKLRQAGYACQLCNGSARLNVHHRTYARRGCEYLSDLTVLCEPCHGKFHDKLP